MGAERKHEVVEGVAQVNVGGLEEIAQLRGVDLFGNPGGARSGDDGLEGGHSCLPSGEQCGCDAVVGNGRNRRIDEVVAVREEGYDGVVFYFLDIVEGVVEFGSEGIVLIDFGPNQCRSEDAYRKGVEVVAEDFFVGGDATDVAGLTGYDGIDGSNVCAKEGECCGSCGDKVYYCLVGDVEVAGDGEHV